ncbi:phage tail tape measure protein [Pseudomonas asplenii]|uniref:hypothetical protein n=1 Tax=Pseudomonas asplenii TaxID=53407 RepID=UPI0022345616|nr:hypothetical protein [Pseudomonas asplenii]UZE30447.1 hypothetical protein LOY63_06840 [Pseudomonas asplenii]
MAKKKPGNVRLKDFVHVKDLKALVETVSAALKDKSTHQEKITDKDQGTDKDKSPDEKTRGFNFKISDLKTGFTDSGLDKVDLEGGGLLAPFTNGLKAAINEQDRQAQADFARKASQLQVIPKAGEVSNGSGAVSPVTPSIGTVSKVPIAQKSSAQVLGETAQHVAALSKALDQISLKIGQALLPAFDSIVTALIPLATQFGQFVANNPALVQGLAAGALAFTAIAGAAAGFIALSSPVGLVAAGIAAAATLIVTFWKPLSGFFMGIWGAISDYFSSHWDTIKAGLAAYLDFILTVFSWTPMGIVINNWGPLADFFSAMWGLLKALALPVMDFLKGIFDWLPLDLIIKNWEPIIGWFFGWVQKLKELFEPIREWLGGHVGGFVTQITGKMEDWTEQQQQRNAVTTADGRHSFFWERDESTGAGSGLTQNANLLVQQTATNNRTQLEGGLTVRFENAPQGLRVDQPQTNQPGLNLTSAVGYRSLSLGGAYGD